MIRTAACIAAMALGAQAARAAGYAGLWFQCQPKWRSEKNYLLVDVKAGEKAWDARWGIADSARGEAQQDPQGNLMLRGCYAVAGKASAHCNPAKPPVFAVLPKAAASGTSAAKDIALQRGAWIRTDQAAVEQLARQCGALRPKSAK